MKTQIIEKDAKSKKEITLPENFSSRIREDILLKVYEAQKLAYTQSYGAMPGAGAGYSASGILRHRRHVWKTTYGKGISRVPRKIMSRNGSSFNWVGATVSSARGGRSPHAPRSEKNLFKKINKKELLLAYNSAFAGTINEDYLAKKYNTQIKSGFILSDDVLKLKTKDFLKLLKTLFNENFDKVLKIKTIRAGRGKMRGRKYKSNAGLLLVISSKQDFKQKGFDIIKVNELKISDLAPNGVPGRITCYTSEAINEIGERFK